MNFHLLYVFFIYDFVINTWQKFIYICDKHKDDNQLETDTYNISQYDDLKSIINSNSITYIKIISNCHYCPIIYETIVKITDEIKNISYYVGSKYYHIINENKANNIGFYQIT